MSEGQRVTAHVSLSSGGTTNVTVSDFTTTDGTSLGSSDAVIVQGFIHENDASFNRIGDPNGDGTFEINVTIESATGAGERTDVTHIVTDVAGIEVSEDASSSQDVTLYGKRVDASKVFVEQNNGVSAGSEVARTVGARGQEETIYELVMSGAADLERRHDPDDDGTFEVDATVESDILGGSGVLREDHLDMKDETGRSNAEMETALTANGGSRDLMLLGSIGLEGL